MPAATPWELTAPESHVLLHGVKPSDSSPFKLAVMQLVAQGVWRLVDVPAQRRFLGRAVGPKRSSLAPGSRFGAPAHPTLRPIWDLYQSAPSQILSDGAAGVEVTRLAAEAMKRYHSLGRYTEQEVVPSLERRGYLIAERRRLLGIFPSTRYVLTALGDQARTDLQQRLDLTMASMGSLVENYPRQALAFMALAGASVLLVPSVFPELQALRRRLETQASGADGAAIGTSAVYPDDNPEQKLPGSPPEPYGEPVSDPPDYVPPTPSPEPGALDLSALDLTALDLDLGALDVDLGALDSLQSAFDAIDSGVDSGAGNGGDGGGGDGGGGGGD